MKLDIGVNVIVENGGMHSWYGVIVAKSESDWHIRCNDNGHIYNIPDTWCTPVELVSEYRKLKKE